MSETRILGVKANASLAAAVVMRDQTQQGKVSRNCQLWWISCTVRAAAVTQGGDTSCFPELI